MFPNPTHPDYLNVPGNADYEPELDINWRTIPSTVKSSQLSGGEVAPDIAALRLEMITKISAQDDVREVLELSHRCDGTFLYMIETPFLNSFPRYVIGTCDRQLGDVRPVFRCGARWSADAEWHRLRHGKNHHLHV
jgi:hypothetical protein